MLISTINLRLTTFQNQNIKEMDVQITFGSYLTHLIFLFTNKLKFVMSALCGPHEFKAR